MREEEKVDPIFTTYHKTLFVVNYDIFIGVISSFCFSRWMDTFRPRKSSGQTRVSLSKRNFNLSM